MSLVEEINVRQSLKRPSYVIDTIDTNESLVTKKNGRKSRSTTQNSKINYNLAVLEATAHGYNQNDDDEGAVVTKEERATQKRMQELDRENYNESHLSRIDVPKHQQQQQKTQTSTVKRILNSKKQLNNYLDENESKLTKKIWTSLEVSEDHGQQKLVICSICGNNSKYKCVRCQTRYCSVKCGDLHNETRCTSYIG